MISLSKEDQFTLNQSEAEGQSGRADTKRVFGTELGGLSLALYYLIL